MSELPENLFALLTLIVAPAVLTNACSVLALNTANRFGRVVDRTRQLTEGSRSNDDPEKAEVRRRQVTRLRKRGELLLRAQTAFYAALGLFVSAALVSIIGAALGQTHGPGYRVAALASFAVGAAAAFALVYGSTLLVRETRHALESLSEEAKLFDLGEAK